MNTQTLPLDALVERLERLDEASVSTQAVAQLVSEVQLPEGSLDPFLNFSGETYTRNLVHRSPLFDVIVLCWEPGQSTPVHDHGGQLGWVRVLRGRLEEVAYAPLEEGARGRLEETGRGVVSAGKTVVTVDPVRAIHRLGNPAEPGRGKNAVSLHVYSRSLDSCLVYDPEQGSAERKELRFDTLPLAA